MPGTHVQYREVLGGLLFSNAPARLFTVGRPGNPRPSVLEMGGHLAICGAPAATTSTVVVFFLPLGGEVIVRSAKRSRGKAPIPPSAQCRPTEGCLETAVTPATPAHYTGGQVAATAAQPSLHAHLNDPMSRLAQ